MEKEVYGLESLVVDIVHHRNIGYAEGRASRDGLREALVRLSYVASGKDAEIIREALEADGEGE